MKKYAELGLLNGSWIKIYPVVIKGTCIACHQNHPTYLTSGLTDIRFVEFFCIVCLHKILEIIETEEKILTCKKCKAILLNENYYNEPKAEGLCSLCLGMKGEPAA